MIMIMLVIIDIIIIFQAADGDWTAQNTPSRRGSRHLLFRCIRIYSRKSTLFIIRLDLIANLIASLLFRFIHIHIYVYITYTG